MAKVESKKHQLILHFKGWVFFILLCVVLSGCAIKAAETEGTLPVETEEKPDTVELYYFNPCESCREGEIFKKKIKEILSRENPGRKLYYESYNTFRQAEQKYLEMRLEEAGLETADVKLPLALYDGRLYQGDYDAIGSGLGEELARRAEKTDPVFVKKMIEEAGETDSVMVLFTTYSCDSCAQVITFMESLGPEVKLTGDGSVGSTRITVLECSIIEPENLKLLQQMMGEYGVEETGQQVPILFYADGYLSGKGDITEKLPGEIAAGKTLNMKWHDNSGGEWEMQGLSLGKAAVTGLINGLNPCSASMLLMVLSLLLMTEKGFLKGSFSYMAGKLTAYVGMGMGLTWLFGAAQEVRFLHLQRILTMIFAVLALVLSILNFADYRNTRKKEYGRVVVQLPRKAREWNHKMIQGIRKVPPAFIMPALFLLGLFISAGEFFCTGQLYAAAVLYMVQDGRKTMLQILVLLLVYVSAMCVVQVVFILIVNKTRNILNVSKLAREGMPVVKLVYGVVFLVMFFVLLFL